MVWKPAKTLGLIIGLIFLFTILGIQIFLIQSMLRQRLDLNLYFIALLFLISLPVLGLWVYWYYGLIALHYDLDRNGLIIDSGTFRHIIPMEAIRQIVPGDQVQVSQGFRGVGWPGYPRGKMRLQGLGPLFVSSTEPLERQLIVVTDTLCYGISPSNPAQFQEDFAARQALKPIRPLQQSLEYSALAALPVWRDRWFWAIVAAAFVLNALLFGIILQGYGELPERIPLHFDAQGQPDRIGFKVGLLVLPSIGLLSLAFNSLLGIALHKRERLGAYLSVVVMLGIQILVWLAAAYILGR